MTAAAEMPTPAQIAPGETLTLLDEAGPGLISHVWVTIASDDPHHLKALVLRMYWDGEATPSVEAPIGDFFGLGLGDYHLYQSIPLQVGSDKALNCFFPMPFQKHARITVTNEGSEKDRRVLFQHRLSRLLQAPARRSALLPRAVPPGRADSGLDESVALEWRPDRERARRI